MPSFKFVSITALFAAPLASVASENVRILDVPDYAWYAGCFGTAAGNLMGYWDRHGFPNFYTGLANGGVAPLDNYGNHVGIQSMWVSMAGFDGRPADQPGHAEDYWTYLTLSSYSYESAATDPYILAGRPEHAPDSLCDFMGSSQNKWTDLDGECSGNIDAFSFNFWDKTGARRVNFTPPSQNGVPIRDIQSGWRAWTEFRGNRAEVFSQLADFNPNIPAGAGFTFGDLKAEIDSGYPVMLFLQNPDEWYRSLPGMSRANPEVHGMLAYGYYVDDDGVNRVRYRTSWGTGDLDFSEWAPLIFQAQMTLRGLVGFHPLPQIKSITPEGANLKVKWDGPSTMLEVNGVSSPVHWYVVEKSDSLAPGRFTAVSEVSTNLETTIPADGNGNAFYRVRLTNSPQ